MAMSYDDMFPVVHKGQARIWGKETHPIGQVIGLSVVCGGLNPVFG